MARRRETLSEFYALRLTPTQRQTWGAAAAAEQVSVAEFVRETVEKEARQVLTNRFNGETEGE